MQKEQIQEVVAGLMGGMPEQVIESLVDVELLIVNKTDEATAILKAELKDEYDPEEDAIPEDCKGVFVGAPMETEESDESEEEETVFFPEGFIVLCANNISDAEETGVVLMHEIGHALGMDEDEVKALGLGVAPSETPSGDPPKETPDAEPHEEHE